MTKELANPTHRRARLTRQGQITVPKSVRDALGARPGDDVEFVSRGDELVIELRPRRSLLDFAGLAADAAERIPATAAELDELVDQGLTAAARHASGRRP